MTYDRFSPVLFIMIQLQLRMFAEGFEPSVRCRTLSLAEWYHKPLGHANGKWMGQESNLRCFYVTDLQSAALAARHTHPWGDQGESNPHKQIHISAKRTLFALLPLSYGHSSSCGT